MAAKQRGGGLPTAAAEEAGPYAGAGEAVAAALGALDAGLAAVAGVELDALDDAGVRTWLREVQRRVDRLTSVRARASGVLEARAVRAAQAGGGRGAAGRQDTRQFLRDELHLPPGEAKRTAETGRQLTSAPATSESFAAGRLSEAHAAVITQALEAVSGPGREQLETRLVAAAEQMDPVGLGRLARRLVAEAEPAQARAEELRRHERRRMSMAQTPQGGLRLSGELFGLQAEKVLTAFRAFQRPDDAHAPRTPGQRGADALEAWADAALAAGQAPARHGVRPHVSVVVEWSQLAEQAGIAQLGLTGPVTIDEIRPLLADAGFSRIVVDGDSVPIEVGRQVRSVPAGLWRALVVRDGGCAWPGCDAPAGWCQVAHGNLAYRDGGRLTLDNAALLCARHHRRFDAGDWRMSLEAGQPVFHRPDGSRPPGGGGSGRGSGGPPGGPSVGGGSERRGDVAPVDRSDRREDVAPGDRSDRRGDVAPGDRSDRRGEVAPGDRSDRREEVAPGDRSDRRAGDNPGPVLPVDDAHGGADPPGDPFGDVGPPDGPFGEVDPPGGPCGDVGPPGGRCGDVGPPGGRCGEVDPPGDPPAAGQPSLPM